MKTLIIDADTDIRDTLKVTLSLQWPEATIIEAEDGATGVEMAQRHLPDIILLDVMLPDMDGFEVCERLRGTVQAPILMLTVMEREVDKVRGLEAGADDYLVKPFSYLELVARMRALLRRGSLSPSMQVDRVQEVGRLKLDNDTRTASSGEESVKLTNKESAILSILMQNAGRTVSHQTLMASVWGMELVDETSYLKLYVHNLRQKLAQIGFQPSVIVSERSVGYRFSDEPESTGGSQ